MTNSLCSPWAEGEFPYSKLPYLCCIMLASCSNPCLLDILHGSRHPTGKGCKFFQKKPFVAGAKESWQNFRCKYFDSLSKPVLTNFIKTTLQLMHGESLMTLFKSVPIQIH